MKMIRLGGTELQLIIIERLLARGYNVPGYYIKNCLKYAWSTMGWYDKSHSTLLRYDDFSWDKDFTSELKRYTALYFESVKNASQMTILSSTWETFNGLVGVSIPNVSDAQSFKDELLSDFCADEINKSFGYSSLFKSIENKRIAIISPFAEIFKSQVDNGSVLKITPQFRPASSIFISYPYCLNNNGRDENTFDTIAAWMKENEKKILDEGCEFVVGSIGATGPIILDYFSRKNISVAYTGGDLQLKFGVMGGRWRKWLLEQPVYLENKAAWLMAPPEDFIPPMASDVENSAYW